MFEPTVITFIGPCSLKVMFCSSVSKLGRAPHIDDHRNCFYLCYPLECLFSSQSAPAIPSNFQIHDHPETTKSKLRPCAADHWARCRRHFPPEIAHIHNLRFCHPGMRASAGIWFNSSVCKHWYTQESSQQLRPVRCMPIHHLVAANNCAKMRANCALQQCFVRFSSKCGVLWQPFAVLSTFCRLINEWILASPEFQLLVVLCSTPFSLAVAQFGMLSPLDRALLRSENAGEESSDNVAFGAAVIRQEQ